MYIKTNLAANLIVVAEKITHSSEKQVWADFHEFLRAHTDILTKSIYSTRDDTKLEDLKAFRDFLCRNFKNHLKYEKLLPTSNQPSRLYGTAKTYKFTSCHIITSEKLKFRSITAQTGTYSYNAAHVIPKYIKPLADENLLIIRNTQDLPPILKAEQSLETNGEYSSDESLFTNIPVRKAIYYMFAEIYDHKTCSQCVVS